MKRLYVKSISSFSYKIGGPPAAGRPRVYLGPVISAGVTCQAPISVPIRDHRPQRTPDPQAPGKVERTDALILGALAFLGPVLSSSALQSPLHTRWGWDCPWLWALIWVGRAEQVIMLLIPSLTPPDRPPPTQTMCTELLVNSTPELLPAAHQVLQLWFGQHLVLRPAGRRLARLAEPSQPFVLLTPSLQAWPPRPRPQLLPRELSKAEHEEAEGSPHGTPHGVPAVVQKRLKPGQHCSKLGICSWTQICVQNDLGKVLEKRARHRDLPRPGSHRGNDSSERHLDRSEVQTGVEPGGAAIWVLPASR